MHFAMKNCVLLKVVNEYAVRISIQQWISELEAYRVYYIIPVRRELFVCKQNIQIFANRIFADGDINQHQPCKQKEEMTGDTTNKVGYTL